MRPPSSRRSAPDPSPADASASAQVPALPPWKAFVVQFSRESTGANGIFAGRVEHLDTARRARFRSAEDLLAVLTRLLGQVRENR